MSFLDLLNFSRRPYMPDAFSNVLEENSNDSCCQVDRLRGNTGDSSPLERRELSPAVPAKFTSGLIAPFLLGNYCLRNSGESPDTKDRILDGTRLQGFVQEVDGIKTLPLDISAYSRCSVGVTPNLCFLGSRIFEYSCFFLLRKTV